MNTSRSQRSTGAADGETRRPIGYWADFNNWWRTKLSEHGCRPSQTELSEWFDVNAPLCWKPEEMPSLKEVRTHAKCLRSTEQVRNYFRKYRAARKVGSTATSMRTSANSDSDSEDGTAPGDSTTAASYHSRPAIISGCGGALRPHPGPGASSSAALTQLMPFVFGAAGGNAGLLLANAALQAAAAAAASTATASNAPANTHNTAAATTGVNSPTNSKPAGSSAAVAFSAQQSLQALQALSRAAAAPFANQPNSSAAAAAAAAAAVAAAAAAAAASSHPSGLPPRQPTASSAAPGTKPSAAPGAATPLPPPASAVSGPVISFSSAGQLQHSAHGPGTTRSIGGGIVVQLPPLQQQQQRNTSISSSHRPHSTSSQHHHHHLHPSQQQQQQQGPSACSAHTTKHPTSAPQAPPAKRQALAHPTCSGPTSSLHTCRSGGGGLGQQAASGAPGGMPPAPSLYGYNGFPPVGAPAAYGQYPTYPYQQPYPSYHPPPPNGNGSAPGYYYAHPQPGSRAYDSAPPFQYSSAPTATAAAAAPPNAGNRGLIEPAQHQASAAPGAPDGAEATAVASSARPAAALASTLLPPLPSTGGVGAGCAGNGEDEEEAFFASWQDDDLLLQLDDLPDDVINGCTLAPTPTARGGPAAPAGSEQPPGAAATTVPPPSALPPPHTSATETAAAPATATDAAARGSAAPAQQGVAGVAQLGSGASAPDAGGGRTVTTGARGQSASTTTATAAAGVSGAGPAYGATQHPPSPQQRPQYPAVPSAAALPPVSYSFCIGAGPYPHFPPGLEFCTSSQQQPQQTHHHHLPAGPYTSDPRSSSGLRCRTTTAVPPPTTAAARTSSLGDVTASLPPIRTSSASLSLHPASLTAKTTNTTTTNTTMTAAGAAAATDSAPGADTPAAAGCNVARAEGGGTAAATAKDGGMPAPAGSTERKPSSSSPLELDHLVTPSAATVAAFLAGEGGLATAAGPGPHPTGNPAVKDGDGDDDAAAAFSPATAADLLGFLTGDLPTPAAPLDLPLLEAGAQDRLPLPVPATAQTAAPRAGGAGLAERAAPGGRTQLGGRDCDQSATTASTSSALTTRTGAATTSVPRGALPPPANATCCPPPSTWPPQPYGYPAYTPAAPQQPQQHQYPRDPGSEPPAAGPTPHTAAPAPGQPASSSYGAPYPPPHSMYTPYTPYNPAHLNPYGYGAPPPPSGYPPSGYYYPTHPHPHHHHPATPSSNAYDMYGWSSYHMPSGYHGTAPPYGPGGVSPSPYTPASGAYMPMPPQPPSSHPYHHHHQHQQPLPYSGAGAVTPYSAAGDVPPVHLSTRLHPYSYSQPGPGASAGGPEASSQRVRAAAASRLPGGTSSGALGGTMMQPLGPGSMMLGPTPAEPLMPGRYVWQATAKPSASRPPAATSARTSQGGDGEASEEGCGYAPCREAVSAVSIQSRGQPCRSVGTSGAASAATAGGGVRRAAAPTASLVSGSAPQTSCCAPGAGHQGRSGQAVEVSQPNTSAAGGDGGASDSHPKKEQEECVVSGRMVAEAAGAGVPVTAVSAQNVLMPPPPPRLPLGQAALPAPPHAVAPAAGGAIAKCETAAVGAAGAPADSTRGLPLPTPLTTAQQPEEVSTLDAAADRPQSQPQPSQGRQQQGEETAASLLDDSSTRDLPGGCQQEEQERNIPGSTGAPVGASAADGGDEDGELLDLSAITAGLFSPPGGSVGVGGSHGVGAGATLSATTASRMGWGSHGNHDTATATPRQELAASAADSTPRQGDPAASTAFAFTPIHAYATTRSRSFAAPPPPQHPPQLQQPSSARVPPSAGNGNTGGSAARGFRSHASLTTPRSTADSPLGCSLLASWLSSPPGSLGSFDFCSRLGLGSLLGDEAGAGPATATAADNSAPAAGASSTAACDDVRATTATGYGHDSGCSVQPALANGGSAVQDGAPGEPGAAGPAAPGVVASAAVTQSRAEGALQVAAEGGDGAGGCGDVPFLASPATAVLESPDVMAHIRILGYSAALPPSQREQQQQQAHKGQLPACAVASPTRAGVVGGVKVAAAAEPLALLEGWQAE